MNPAPLLGHVGIGLLPDAATLSLPAAVTTLRSHQRPPTIGIDNPANQNDKGSSPTVVYITTTSPTSTSKMTSTAASGSPMASDNDSGECRLLGSFAVLVQLALGGLALLSLVYKRWRERPQRPIKVWWFDVSKQVVGSILVHVANVFMSTLTSGRFSIRLEPGTVAARMAVDLVKRSASGYTPNPCSLYLLNLAIDTTLGIPILILLLRIYTALVALTPLGKPRESIQSGNYGRPPKAVWWLKQSFIYFCGLFGMKICVLFIFLVFPWISRVGDWALGWTEGNEKLQIIFVMMLFPLIMNALQYYIIDSFIKLKEETEDARAGATPVYEGLPDESDAEGEVLEDDDVESRKTRSKTRSTVKLTERDDSADREYDPNVDGDSQTVVGSSSSRTAAEGKRGGLPKELYPKE